MEDTCLGCGFPLIEADKDPNGENNYVCLRCRAEEEHDYDLEPNTNFNRLGHPEEKEEKVIFESEKLEQSPISTLKWKGDISTGYLSVLDQRALPLELQYLECHSLDDVYSAIANLAVRGAPLIGVTAAYGVVLGLRSKTHLSRFAFDRKFKEVSERLLKSRPTAVNLKWAIHEMKEMLRTYSDKPKVLLNFFFKKAEEIRIRDGESCNKMAFFGASLLGLKNKVLTYCNTGYLATCGKGTALGVIYEAQTQGKEVLVYACETRPIMQGSRLTTWELTHMGVKNILICDNMAATLMKKGHIDAVFVGADRIALNGDTANKVGTYNLAILAQYHKIPFYVVAPLNAFDLKCEDGSLIPIEYRDEDEIREVCGYQMSEAKVKVLNPAFDVTPSDLITAIITDKGIINKPNFSRIKSYLNV